MKSAKKLDRHEIRQGLEQQFTTVEDLTAFVQDRFLSVSRQFSPAMTYTARVNLLMAKESPEKISKYLTPGPVTTPVPPHPARRGASPAETPDASTIYVAIPAGAQAVELLGWFQRWCHSSKQTVLQEHHPDLCPGQFSSGWRQLRIEVTPKLIILDAFPTLLDSSGHPVPKSLAKISRSSTEATSFRFLPRGRGSAGYLVTVGAAEPLRLSLVHDLQSNPITFLIGEPTIAHDQVHHE